MSGWNEHRIASALCRQTFQRKCLLLVPNCNWTGHECDVLGVTGDLRVIDIEVKISRADLKADAKKDKWWHRLSRWRDAHGPDQLMRWPPKVWKHYYALPADIWMPALFDSLPSTASGVLLVRDRGTSVLSVESIRRATPNKDADKLSSGDAIDIARLANLRMWDAMSARWPSTRIAETT